MQTTQSPPAVDALIGNGFLQVPILKGRLSQWRVFVR